MAYKRVWGVSSMDELKLWYTYLGDLNQLVDLELGGDGFGTAVMPTLLPYDKSQNTFRVYGRDTSHLQQVFANASWFPDFEELSSKTQSMLVMFAQQLMPGTTQEQARQMLTAQYATMTLDSYIRTMGDIPSGPQFFDHVYPGPGYVEATALLSPSFELSGINKMSFEMQDARSPLVSHALSAARHLTRLHLTELSAPAFQAASLQMLMTSILYSGLNYPLENIASLDIQVIARDVPAATTAMSQANSFPTRAQFATAHPVLGPLFAGTYVGKMQEWMNMTRAQAELAFDQLSYKTFTETVQLRASGKQVGVSLLA